MNVSRKRNLVVYLTDLMKAFGMTELTLLFCLALSADRFFSM